MLSSLDDLSEVKQIRNEVFINECGMLDFEENDTTDSLAMYVIVYQEDDNWKENRNKQKTPVASGRIMFDGSRCVIDQVAVLKEYRNKKYGDFAVKMLLNKAFTSGIEKVELYSPEKVMGFFETIGFKCTEENFIKDEVKHIKMIISSNGVITCCSKKNNY